MLEPDEVQQRFGANPLGFYAYNIATSFLSVLFSEPDGGIFETVRAWITGGGPPRLYLAVVSSCLTTGLIVWAIAARVRGGIRSLGDESNQLLAISAVVVIANSAMSFVYTKHEILSVAGCFYAVAVFVAGRDALARLDRGAPAVIRTALVFVLGCAATLWAFRSVGVHHVLRVEAFKVRNDWARVPASVDHSGGIVLLSVDDGSAADQRAAALVRQLRHDALDMPISNPYLAPRWVDRWLGE